jgi:NAD(P)-dependent dehydrogenase (short-subunit alcohol dehydrogenase family)
VKSVVVTGASTGIGQACVQRLVQAGFHVFGGVRRQADADRLARAHGSASTPLLFDVTDAVAVAQAAAYVRERLKDEPLHGLVNNAGIANPGPLLHIPLEEFRQQLEVNVTGQLIVTQAFAPLLGAAPDAPAGSRGRIVMMSSVGGKNASPFVGPYNASKFALEGLSEALRRELMLYGVDVIVVAPGAVATPIWEKADTVDVSRYAHTPYAGALEGMKRYMLTLGRNGLPPERIAQVVLEALTAPRPRTRYIATPQPLQNWLMLTLPKRWVDRVVAGRLGLLPPQRP